MLPGASNKLWDLIPLSSPCVPPGGQHLLPKDFEADTTRLPSALAPGSSDVVDASSSALAATASGLALVPVCPCDYIHFGVGAHLHA
jgi:hypothetical protein